MSSEFLEEAREAIDKVFSDKSQWRADTKADLEDLAGHIEVMLDTLDDDEDF